MREFEGDYVLADNVWDETVWVWRQTEAPRGCKVEIVEGLITVAPLSSVAHNGVAGRVQRRLHDVVPEEWGVYQRLPLAVPGRLGLFESDLAVVPEALLRAGDEQLILASKAELVGEIVSAATATNDRIHKLAGYAQAGVPLYLLIDSLAPGGPTVTLYGEPKGDVYRVLSAAEFGDPLRLPAPFDLTIDTSEFPES
ncbi:Uma2 family endonuclease [Streptomyces rochei]|uniref:Uma2 family endonuclease n=1 Tax=Streptomyces TaxID=1883 RepID=UPI000A390B12|nr:MULTISPECIES: Uma2 family endonuclease [Streptomyces]MBQ0880203.1 Uma2 family endonuclease [Streptomyces sp. RT42]WDI20247.1 Uma2 family endonuclease [Streptomyces enissocaesilis]